MLTVSQLAKACSISRTSILYYEREGLLLPKNRSDNGYRWYGKTEIERLGRILSYRSFGVPVSQIRSLLDEANEEGQKQILLQQFNALERDIQLLRLQQKAIVHFMDEPELLDKKVINKERWTQIMRDAGLSDEDMRSWHIQFETTEPAAHQAFLETLKIDPEEIAVIRAWSKN
jgi:DNA-binding transcriptional MerR regulator